LSKKSSKEFLKKHFDYVDSITIVDKTGKVVAQQRYNPRFAEEENKKENNWAINKNILEVIPSVTPETSTLLRVLKSGKIVYSDKQVMWDRHGRKFVTTNINFPIVSRGNIIGAIELSKDMTHIDNDEENYHTTAEYENDLEQNYTANYILDDIIAVTPRMKKLKNKVKKIANSTSSVLIYGETGTGKELFVQAIHNLSYRKFKPFIPVNCAALPENLLEGILFGSQKGAFTGAENKKGLFQEANKGTIYLDEVNSMPINLQTKLLRTLQEKQIMPLGGSKPKKIDVRVIASTNQDPTKLIDSKIRKDLYYRLNVINLEIPPLRNRTAAIPVLADHFIKKYNHMSKKEVKEIDKRVNDLFLSYQWPGNVRELEHVLEAAMNVVEGRVIKLEHLPVYMSESESSFKTNIDPLDNEIGPLNKMVENMERRLIKNALNKTDGNKSKASQLLEIPRTTLQYKIKKYKIEI